MSDNHDFNAESLRSHRSHGGKVAIVSKMPGVAEPCLEIARNKRLAYEYTFKRNTVAVVSDGSAVLGLGNLGPEASLPVMEGKAVLFKKFADIDAIPIVLDTQDTEEIIRTVTHIAPTFGGINLEDISAPRCFEIERRLKALLPIPVMHDDQHGTAVVTLAGLFNAIRITGRELADLSVVLNGAGAAGIAIVHLLRHVGVTDITLCDSKGIVHLGRGDLNGQKMELARITNPRGLTGQLGEAMAGTDCFIGVSVADSVSMEMVRAMNPDPILFAMANPIPEIMPELAHKAGAKVVATGRSDYPNQVNNVLAFPGIFRGLLDAKASDLTMEMYVAAAKAIASSIEEPTPDRIIPNAFDPGVGERVAKAVYELAILQQR
jgi:malate dehydrogenase (oxaloacetate-decarboxylating)